MTLTLNTESMSQTASGLQEFLICWNLDSISDFFFQVQCLAYFVDVVDGAADIIDDADDTGDPRRGISVSLLLFRHVGLQVAVRNR